MASPTIGIESQGTSVRAMGALAAAAEEAGLAARRAGGGRSDPKGKAVAADSYSALIRARFQSNDRTLTEEEILTWYNSIIAALTGLGGVQRA